MAKNTCWAKTQRSVLLCVTALVLLLFIISDISFIAKNQCSKYQYEKPSWQPNVCASAQTGNPRAKIATEESENKQ
eukprot:6490902-Amphidinium_carterae.1